MHWAWRGRQRWGQLRLRACLGEEFAEPRKLGERFVGKGVGEVALDHFGEASS